MNDEKKSVKLDVHSIKHIRNTQKLVADGIGKQQSAVVTQVEITDAGVERLRADGQFDTDYGIFYMTCNGVIMQHVSDGEVRIGFTNEIGTPLAWMRPLVSVPVGQELRLLSTSGIGITVDIELADLNND